MARLLVACAALVAAATTLGGCAAVRGRSAGVEKPELTTDATASDVASYWWAARFRVSWPPDQPPDYAVDLLLAHAIVKPVLEEYTGSLRRWRFHRRAVRDPAGHQFSFLFYSDVPTAVAVLGKIRDSALLADAVGSGLVEEVGLSDLTQPSGPGVEDTSDPSWPLTVQRNWPSFIMGASALWLGLIDDRLREAPPPAGSGAQDLLEVYRAAAADITAIWKQNGQHAFLHHLSALFGYEPLRIIKDIKF